MKTPRISILMPIYKVETYLREAVDSILAQTFTDFELICLDDCSPDNSAAILDTYTDLRIVRYRGETNVGLANILNVGMTLARGELIARMDSDDISLPNRLQVQVDYLDAHPEAALCSCGMQQFGAANVTMAYNNTLDDIRFNAFFFSPVLHASSVWRKEKFATLRFEQDFVPAEDYRMWTQALLRGVKLANIPDVLYWYRIHPTQATKHVDASLRVQERVRQEYVAGLFPQATAEEQNMLVGLEQIGEKSLEQLYEAMQLLVRLNAQTHVFDEAYLCKQTIRYYQNVVFRHLQQHGFTWKYFCELRLKQKVKYLLGLLF